MRETPSQSDLLRRLTTQLARLPRPPSPRAAFVAIAGVALAIVAFDLLIDRPLRRILERKMNAPLRGYSVTLGAADLSPWNLSLDLDGLTIVQDAHREPPVAHFPRVEFSVQWRSLLRGRLVGDATLEAPQLYVNLLQLREERTDELELDERGWQAALQAAYPLKINELQIHDGGLVYTHEDPKRPLELSDVELVAQNIRNIRSPERTYPSEVQAMARMFDRGRVAIVGHADFLAEPYAGVQADIHLGRVPLERLDPVTRDIRLVLRGGTLSADGAFEYAPARRHVHLTEVEIVGIRIDYLFDAELTERALAAAQAAESGEEMSYRLDVLRLVDGELGWVNRDTDPGYRLFVSDADVRLTDLRSRSDTVSKLRAEGRFMGSGTTVVTGAFRPDQDGADFNVAVAIQGTDLATMNDFWKTYAKADVAAGTFSFYSELAVADGALEGYVKPLFEDVDVYDPEQDRHKNFFRRIYEEILEGLSKLLENQPRDEVATVAKLSGSLEDPKASNLQVALNLIRNAFFEAILPGFEREKKQAK